ncbi:efflux RND transporter periplasmic adaptor subunit [Candidatus Manganitrophus noduliformans]|uniref:Efflux RND transporter periplasmic adaptor subunit n=1 Tax=Candidatus Manganitrophus noduliformans TaxID=2606439 RepID=A0A7X6DNQ2_9BACT|nr:efflux RND transporter periplasmic adaptor subunit [Candidatus Manganitrophus noduliformans]NKE70474.1 efflux RND transporter periplasmic adaptor subunit [Candidatus Manganitrophus noduliformans]
MTMVVLVVVAVGFAWTAFSRMQEEAGSKTRSEGDSPAPVEVAPIERGPIVLRRTFSGTLEALAEFVVAPKVSGRVEGLAVDLADTVRRGQVVAELDDDEHLQAVAQARADLAVAKANLAEAESGLDIALRELQRIETLLERGVASESQRDTAKINQLAKQAQLDVAEAQLTRAESSLETANIRLRYTKITADWSGGDDRRVVAERYVDEGQTVSANAPLLLIVELDPLTGVIFVTEKDYARLRVGQTASLMTDAYPGEPFEGRIARISPVFREATRQARVEMTIENAKRRLKPGMFIRATIVLDRVPETTIVPEQALTTRGDRTGVFVVNEADRTVAWREVTVGIREEGRVQVEGEGLSGRVVTLGQQLVDDGSRVTIPAEQGEAASLPKTAERG